MPMSCKDLEFQLDHGFISYDDLTLISCHNLELCVLIKNGEPFHVTIEDIPTLYMKIFNHFQDKFNHKKHPPMFLKFGHKYNGMPVGKIDFKKTHFGKDRSLDDNVMHCYLDWTMMVSHQNMRTYDDFESSLMECATFTDEDNEYFSFYDWLISHHSNANYSSETTDMSDFEYMIRKWKSLTIDEIESYKNYVNLIKGKQEIKKFLDDLKFNHGYKTIPATYVDVSQFKDCSNIPVYKDGVQICEVYADDPSLWKICKTIANTINNTNGGNNNMKFEKKETIKESEITVSTGSQENVDRYVADLKDLELGEAFRIVDDKNPRIGNRYLVYVVVSVDKENTKDKVAVLSLDTAKVTFMDPKTRVWVYKKFQCKYVTGSFWMEHEVEARF